MHGISQMYIRIHTLAASRAGSVPIEYLLKAGKIRFERTCCILEKLASMSCSSKRELKIETESIRELWTDLELQGDELVDLVNLISNRSIGAKPGDGDGCGV